MAEEGQRDGDLHLYDYSGEAECSGETAPEEEDGAEGGEDEEDGHLCAEAEGVDQGAEGVLAVLEAEDGEEEEEHGEAVVEASEEEDGVQALREDEEGEDVGWYLKRKSLADRPKSPRENREECGQGYKPYLRLPVASHHDRQRGHVQHGKQLLRQKDIGPLIRQVIQSRVDVYMHRGVDQRPCPAHELGVVALAVDELRDVLHVCDPVDFGVCRRGKISLASEL